MSRWNTCYVCGGYSRGKRHRGCAPAWKRRRFVACEKCGQPSRGVMHKRCRFPDQRLCSYCKEPYRPSRGATGPLAGYHHGCRPSIPELALFADLPTIIQRRCQRCFEWYPYASTVPTDEDVATDYWPKTNDRRGATSQSTCRSCAAERRRASDSRLLVLKAS